MNSQRDLVRQEDELRNQKEAYCSLIHMVTMSKIGENAQCVRDGGFEEDRWSQANRQDQERSYTRTARPATNYRQRGTRDWDMNFGWKAAVYQLQFCKVAWKLCDDKDYRELFRSNR